MPQLSWNRYGKSCVRFVKVRRPPADNGGTQHEIVDLALDIQLEGAFEPVYLAGENERCLATDTMKNTVYALARHDPIDHVEAFAGRLAAHFVAQAFVERARVSAVEQRWEPIPVGDAPHPHAFVQPGGERGTTVVVHDAGGTRVTSGLTDLVVLKTTDSSFTGFPRDRFTTLPDAADRLLATSITARWVYRAGTDDFAARHRIRRALLETFASHDSRSVQHTLYAMGTAALSASADVDEITLTLPNRHHLLVDLAPFGLDNPGAVFAATPEPFGLIEGTIRR